MMWQITLGLLEYEVVILIRKRLNKLTIAFRPTSWAAARSSICPNMWLMQDISLPIYIIHIWSVYSCSMMSFK